MSKLDLCSVVLLSPEHKRASFDCGDAQLNQYLQIYALQNQKRNMVRNYVCCDKANSIKGFYSLTYGQIIASDLPSDVNKGSGKYPIPVMVLARLGVDKNYQGVKLGRALLKDAIMRTLQAADIAGLKLLIVHAKHDSARLFYEKHGFQSSLNNSLLLFLPIKLAQ